jgi:hypothetical protein
MANFAVISGTTVVNIIVADSKEIAEQVTGLNCIEYTEENIAYIDGEYFDGYFYGAAPFPSWIRDGKGNWIAPVEMPAFDPEDRNLYTWNEETVSWDANPIVIDED